MQIKKVDWINRPAKVRVTSRTLTFRQKEKSAALYTLSETEDLLLRYEGENVSFLMLHTDRDRLKITPDGISFSMHGTKAIIPGRHGAELFVEKRGDTVTFKEKDVTVFEWSDPAFRDSASIGFLMEGSENEVTLFFR